MVVLLDACTVINMVHIDEGEFLLKQLRGLNFHVCKTVFDEISVNIFNKFKNIMPYPDNEKREIDNKLNNIRSHIYNNPSFLELCNDVKIATKYTKMNGEFHSTVLATYINTFEKLFVHFYTDDRPALQEFLPFLSRNQIGNIGDSVDLLILLYRHNEAFNRNDLKNFLSKLFAEYVGALSEIEKAVASYQIPKLLIRNQKLRNKREEIRLAIADLNIAGLRKIYFDLFDDKSAYGSLIDLLGKYNDFFMKDVTREYLEKIRNYIRYADSEPFYKWAN